MLKRSEMQGVESREYEVAECYFDQFSITVVLGSENTEGGKTVSVTRHCTAHCPAFADKRDKEDIASYIRQNIIFSFITDDVEQKSKHRYVHNLNSHTLIVYLYYFSTSFGQDFVVVQRTKSNGTP